LRFFHEEDLAIARRVLRDIRVDVFSIERDSDISYEPATGYREAVNDALARAVADSDWRGSGLEFDRV
jgi:hypothetical protein